MAGASSHLITNEMLNQHQSAFKSDLYLSNYKSNFEDMDSFDMYNKTAKSRLHDHNQQALSIVNPLIAMIGISEYDAGVFHDLKCVISDYKNVEFAFNISRKYSMVHFDKYNQIIHKKCNHSSTSVKVSSTTAMGIAADADDNDDVKVNVSSRDTFKLRWNEEEIFEFNEKVGDILKCRKYNYDALIYFISCHGDTGGVIYDSTGNKIPLITIFDKFNNQNCIKLRNKPKIYFIEACRGSMRTKRFENSLFDDNKIDNLNVTETKVSDIAHDYDDTKLKTKMDSMQMGNNSNCALSVPQSCTDIACTPPLPDTVDDTKESTIDFKKRNIIFSKYNYNREIYANTDGYAVVEPGSKGGYMTQSITQAIVNNDLFVKDFDEIMIHTRKIMLKLMGMSASCGAQVIDDHTNIPRKMFFK